MAIKIKGRKMGSLKRVRDSLKSSGGGNTFLKRVPEDGITVRFLTEPDGWFGYREHYDETLKSYYPCIEGSCPGCEQGLRASFRYATNALDVDEDRVLPLVLAQDCANRVMIRHDRYGTLLDRDYMLTREGTGFDTTYDVESEGKKTRVLKKYDLFDLEEEVGKQFERTFNEDDDEDDEEEDVRPARRTVGRKAAGARKGVGTKRASTTRTSNAATPARRTVTRKAASTVKKAAPAKTTAKRGTSGTVRRRPR